MATQNYIVEASRDGKKWSKRSTLLDKPDADRLLSVMQRDTELIGHEHYENPLWEKEQYRITEAK